MFKIQIIYKLFLKKYVCFTFLLEKYSSFANVTTKKQLFIHLLNKNYEYYKSTKILTDNLLKEAFYNFIF